MIRTCDAARFSTAQGRVPFWSAEFAAAGGAVPVSPSPIALAAAVSSGAWLARPASAQETVKRKGFSIKVTSPANQDIVLGRTKITAEVKIDKPELVEKVEFFVGDKLIFIDTEPPYECWYDFGEEAKDVVIRAVATHREEITVSDFIVTRKLDLAFAVKVNRVLLNASVFDKDGNLMRARKEGLRRLRGRKHSGDPSSSPRDGADAPRHVMDVSGSMQEDGGRCRGRQRGSSTP